MDATHPPRVLLRPHTAGPPPPQNGVVVVGFVGGRYDDVSHLVNKIIDSHVFGSGNGGTSFQFEPAAKEWLETRKLSYYHRKEQGIVYVQFSRVGYWKDGSDLEDQEFGDLQAWLFMFSVCHLIILVQEGSRFDTQLLKKFRALQAAKHSMGPFIRSLNMPSSGQQSSAYAQMPDSLASSKNPSSGRGRLILNRNAAQGQMAGLGSHTSMSPGQCSPVVLFVFRDDFTEFFPDEEPSEASSSSNVNTFGRPNRPMKGSNTLVVLARRTDKGEAGARKKLQSSLESQIRFSIKKCRTLSGFDSVHGGSRTGPAAISSPLFSLDSSRAVLLIDHSSSKSGESLEYAIGLVEEVLDGRATPDSLLLESHQRYREDHLALKEFIFRQSETLSGKGVAAASNSSRKSMTAAPQLPTIDIWSSSCQAILKKILSTKYVAPQDGNDRSADPLEYAVSHIDHISRSNTIFSSLWCQKAYPVAKQVYLDGLPRYYTSGLHDDHLNKALRVLKAMVKGPCVQSYLTKLKDECVLIWNSRQLCDAVSLTGNPCIHPMHETDSDKGPEFEPHSSGFFYLHACACGRSRRLRPDPFEQETANSMNVFVDCDKNLPAVQLPPDESVGGFFLSSSSSSSWHILRVGSAKYYDPSKGLHQSGFYATHRFLLKWMLHFEKIKEINHGSSDGASAGLDNQGGEAGMQRRPSFAIERSSSKANFASVVGFSNFTMRKPFSEVVAGAASSKNPLSIDVKGVGKSHRTGEIDHDVESKSIMKIDLNADGVTEDYSSEFSTRANSYEQMKDFDHVQPITAYVGFEHECPHGHRFVLSSEHLNELGSPYAVVTEDNDLPPRDRRRRQETDKTAKVTNHGRNRRQSRGGGRARNSHNSKEKSANNGISVSNKTTQPNRRGKDQMEMGDIDLEKGATADHGGSSSSLLDRSLPIYMNCPHCKASTVKNEASSTKFASTVSQLQRIFVVTPPFPVLVAADPIVQFEVSCLPHSVPNRESKLRFSLGCPVILPPESFLSIRLPFVYTVELEDGTIHSLRPFENEPHLTACILKGTTLSASNGKNLDTAESAT